MDKKRVVFKQLLAGFLWGGKRIWGVLQRDETSVLDEEERVLQCEKLLFEGIEKESFESMIGVVRGDQKEEFWEHEKGCLKGSRYRVLRAWERLLEGIKKKSFESVRRVVWRDRERERVLRAWKGLLKEIKKKSFESMRRVVQMHLCREFFRVERDCWKGSVRRVF